MRHGRLEGEHLGGWLSAATGFQNLISFQREILLGSVSPHCSVTTNSSLESRCQCFFRRSTKDDEANEEWLLFIGWPAVQAHEDFSQSVRRKLVFDSPSLISLTKITISLVLDYSTPPPG